MLMIFLDNGFQEGISLIITPTFLILSSFAIIAYSEFDIWSLKYDFVKLNFFPVLFVYFWIVTRSIEKLLRRDEQPYGINDTAA